MKHVRRRQFLLTAGMLLVAPIVARAQRATKPYRIGILQTEEAQTSLQQSLRELGYVEGRDVVFEIRTTEGKSERLDDFALDLVRLKVDVIVALNPASVLSAKRATATVPIVMMNTPDPVQLGLVANLARPGGNITGTTTLTLDLSTKQLELLKEAVPRASRVAVLLNPDNRWHPAAVKGLQARSGSLGLQLQALARGASSRRLRQRVPRDDNGTRPGSLGLGGPDDVFSSPRAGRPRDKTSVAHDG
ncbi:MAG: hypothetical protein E6H48_20715 [Betaproteobacteria bacterium]|nr:MAG: hypothetical protein E6H48_20715 [Betaproteobacteria bacterium]